LKPAAFLAVLGLLAVPVSAAGPRGGKGKVDRPKLDRALQQRSARGVGESRVIVELLPNAPTGLIRAMGGVEGRRLKSFRGQVARIGNRHLNSLANNPWVKSIHVDRPVFRAMDRTSVMTGVRAVQYAMGYDGTGVGVAIVDSGITAWHDDLMGGGIGGQKVVQFVDFVGHQPTPYDDNGHGTHVAGIVAGSGYDSYGLKAGVAPGAHLVGLKVLDGTGGGYMSDVISALDWVVENRAAYNIRVVNLSVGAAVTESFETDPLTLAAKRVVDAGVVLVAAAGNMGRNALGQTQYGGIAAPGNAPWVLTVGASSHVGTLTRADDTVGGYSSRGPTAVDYLAKPDLVAPGTGVVSLSDPNSFLYASKPQMLLDGLRSTTYKPYLSLTGTSMAAPVVSGTVALMLQANPALTPNAVKAILQYTAQDYPQYNALTEGAGFLNARGAVDLAQFFRHARAGDSFPKGLGWSRHIIWGNHLLANGMIMPTANAWAANVVWGASRDAVGDNIVWGTSCPADSDCENILWGAGAEEGETIVWGAACDEFDLDCDNVVWGNSIDTDGDGFDDNIVWGNSLDTDGDGFGDNIVWGASLVCDEFDAACDNIVWGNGAAEDENVVWGSDCGDADCDNIVWGAADDSDPDNIVWGAAEDAENIVWGASADDEENIVWGNSIDEAEENIVWGAAEDDENIVWGAAAACDELDPECDNIVWGNSVEDPDAENIVWGASCDESDLECDNIVWGAADEDENLVWGNTSGTSVLFADLAYWLRGLFSVRVFNSLFYSYPLVAVDTSTDTTTTETTVTDTSGGEALPASTDGTTTDPVPSTDTTTTSTCTSTTSIVTDPVTGEVTETTTTTCTTTTEGGF